MTSTRMANKSSPPAVASPISIARRTLPRRPPYFGGLSSTICRSTIVLTSSKPWPSGRDLRSSWSSIRVPATVDIDDLAGKVRSVRTDQEVHHGRDLVGGTGAAERHLPEQAPLDRRVGGSAHAGTDVTGRHPVAADAVLGELARTRHREVGQGGFRRAVVRTSGMSRAVGRSVWPRRTQLGDSGDQVDDGGVRVRAEQWHRLAHGQETCGHIDGEYPLPFRQGDLAQRPFSPVLLGRYAYAVDEHIETVGTGGGLHNVPGVLLARHVNGQVPVDHRGQLRFRLGPGRDGDRGATNRQPLANRRTDVPGAARYECPHPPDLPLIVPPGP